MHRIQFTMVRRYRIETLKKSCVTAKQRRILLCRTSAV